MTTTTDDRAGCGCIYSEHCDQRATCSLRNGGTVNDGGGVCPPSPSRAKMAALWDSRHEIAALRSERDEAIADRDRYAEALRGVIEWCEEQWSYCRPPRLADAPADEVDARRGPCAAHGAVVYGLVIDKARREYDS